MRETVKKAVGKNIRQLRKKANLTQDMLSARLQIRGCDITRSALAKIEAGQRHLYSYEIILIKEIIGCTYDDIFKI
jgi:transcriptional regulator with XRE-family HTH domain